jgi:integrase
MKTTYSRKTKKSRRAYHVATLGRVKVSVYKRTMPNGSPGFMVANYSGEKRRFDSYTAEADAVEAANRLARQLSERDTKAATMTETQAVEYVRATEVLQPFNVSVGAASEALSAWLKKVGDLAALHEAVKFYAARHKTVTPKRVSAVVAELLAIKKSRGASVRYLEDLRNRLTRFANAFLKEAGHVTTAEIQAWLDTEELAPQNYMGFRRVIHLLFEFAVQRGYAVDNPVNAMERVKVKHGATQIFSPVEIARLLSAATPDFLPCLAIGAFAGLRSAEIERLTWADVDLTGRHIIVSAGNSKTASRRIVPMKDNLAAWLANYGGRTGNIWRGTHEEFYDAQQVTAAASEVKADAEKGIAAQKPVKWKANGLRHSFASYRFAESGDAGRVAGECGNSASVIHKHYRELVKPADAQRWFNVKPESPANVVTMAAAN